EHVADPLGAPEVDQQPVQHAEQREPEHQPEAAQNRDARAGARRPPARRAQLGAEQRQHACLRRPLPARRRPTARHLLRRDAHVPCPPGPAPGRGEGAAPRSPAARARAGVEPKAGATDPSPSLTPPPSPPPPPPSPPPSPWPESRGQGRAAATTSPTRSACVSVRNTSSSPAAPAAASRRRSSIVPIARTRPSRRIAIRSQSASATSSVCVDRNTVPPCCAN